MDFEKQQPYSGITEQEREKPIQIADDIFLYERKKEIEIFDNDWTVSFLISDGKLILQSQLNNGGDRYETKLSNKTINFLRKKVQSALMSFKNKKQSIVNEEMLLGVQNRIDEESMRMFGRPYNELSDEEMEKLSDYV